MLTFIVCMAFLAVMLGITYIGARRFAAKQRALGRWDEYGPLEETEGPRRAAAANLPFSGVREMLERKEVVGLWKGRVLRRRRPGQNPDGPA